MQRCHNYKINCGVKISKEHCRYFTHKKKKRWKSGAAQAGCEGRIEDFIKNLKKMGGGGWGRVGEGQGGCERRILKFL